MRGLLLIGCTLGAAVRPMIAQTTGTWETGFLHQHDPSTGLCTDYLAAFNTDTGTNPTYVAPPTPITGPLGWGTNVWSPTGNFNAIHMALIPKGVHRGKILVWNRFPVCLRPGAPCDTSNFWMFQGWSIIDPNWTSGSGQPRFRNFLLPIEPYGTSFPQPSSQSPAIFRGIFCTGHAWSQNGDLIVAGGATYDWQSPTGAPGETGANFLYLFDPSAASAPFPGQTSALYPNEKGAWVPNATGLHDDRYYPTVTLSQRLQRLGGLTGNPREVGMVSGGSDTSTHDPRNSYECWEAKTSGVSSPFAVDPENNSGSLSGPVTGGSVALTDEWFDEYPRIYLCGDGKMITSGWSHLSSKVDLDTTATNRAWDISVGRTGSSWQHDRKYGSSVFFGALGPYLTDLVVRLDGADPTQSPTVTDSTEYCLATTTNAAWSSLGQDPAGARDHINAVILPDASIVVIGGTNATGPVLQTSVYRHGIGWTVLGSSGDSPTIRKYHTTAVLLPDGRVFVGGGEGHGTTVDYDIFRPHYLQGSSQRPSIVSISDGGAVVTQDSEGTWLLENGQQGLTVECTDLEEIDHIERVVLMAPGSITHHCDMTARYVELASVLVQGTNDQRLFQIPNNNRLPRGYYMLFVLNSGLIPSVAAWVKIQ